MTEDSRLGIPTPMSFTRFVSSIYKLAPENPFDLPLPFARRFSVGRPPPPGRVVCLDDRPVGEAVALVLFYQFLGNDPQG